MPEIVASAFRAAALSTTLLAAFTGGCATMPDRRAESPPLPAAWRDAPPGAEHPVSDWWRGFNDPTLNRLVAEALADGPSVRLAMSRVREARAASQATIAQFLPEVLATGSGQYARVIDGQTPAGSQREQMTGAYGAQVSWEAPLFAIGPAVSGARAATQGAFADLRGAQVALVADVAQAYVDLRAAQAGRAALARSVDAADELARILSIGAQAGLSSQVDAADARRQAETARARLADLVIEERRAQNILAILRGRAPGTEDAATQNGLEPIDAPLPAMPLASAPAAPADLLRLRPDVARAEADTLAAAANVGAARADMLPRLTLTGSIDVTSALIGNAPGATLATATPFISIPLFDWGRRLAATRQRDAQFEQSLIRYRQVVAQAVADASNALVALEQGRLRVEATRYAADAADITARGARASHARGIASLADRLRAEQQLIDAELARISAEAQFAGAAVTTYRAFGGGPALDMAQPEKTSIERP